MATVHFPGKIWKQGRSNVLHAHIPYLMDCDDKYVEGINHYLLERSLGRINPKNVLEPNVKLKRLDAKTIKGIAYQLCDYLNFLESSVAHPLLGKVGWRGTRRWLVQDLYATAMENGYWANEFWRSGTATELSYDSTIKPRADENVRCGVWLEANDYIDDFDQGLNDDLVGRCLIDAAANFRNLGRLLPSRKQAPRRTRQNPGDVLPPSLEEIIELLGVIKNPTYRLAALLLFETGIRASELTETTLIPPSWFGQGSRPRGKSDIGILPDTKVIFGTGIAAIKACRWKVLGKNKKIRFAMAPQKIFKALWRYALGYRAKTLRKTRSRKDKATNQLFIDCDGAPMSYDNLRLAISEANDVLGRDERITAHLLRHAYACSFLEQGLLEQMRLSNVSPETATFTQFMEMGEGILVVLQDSLGHEFMETTLRYLRQLAQGKIAFRYQIAFNKWLDKLDPILATL